MRRSNWKGPFIDYFLFSTLQKPGNTMIKTMSRASMILPCMLGKIFFVYNGKKFIQVRITENMLGYRLGNFVVTRLRHVYKRKFKIKSRKK